MKVDTYLFRRKHMGTVICCRAAGTGDCHHAALLIFETQSIFIYKSM